MTPPSDSASAALDTTPELVGLIRHEVAEVIRREVAEVVRHEVADAFRQERAARPKPAAAEATKARKRRPQCETVLMTIIGVFVAGSLSLGIAAYVGIRSDIAAINESLDKLEALLDRLDDRLNESLDDVEARIDMSLLGTAEQLIRHESQPLSLGAHPAAARIARQAERLPAIPYPAVGPPRPPRSNTG